MTTPDGKHPLAAGAARARRWALTMMPAMTAWLAAAPLSQTAAASALNNVLRQLFGAFGTAIFATILHERIVFHYVDAVDVRAAGLAGGGPAAGARGSSSRWPTG